MKLHYILKTWGQTITSATQTYVTVQSWEAVKHGIINHVNFTQPVADVIFTIQGEAGVGKTRLAYEVLRTVPNAENLVVYTNDEQRAIGLAYILANEANLKAIFVADECTVSTRSRLRSILSGHKNRVRMIAVDNTGTRVNSGTPEHWLQQIPEEVVKEILRANFPEVSEEHRNAYARLSGGFIRLAADMCLNDGMISSAGHLGPSLPLIKDYFEARLTSQQQEVVFSK